MHIIQSSLHVFETKQSEQNDFILFPIFIYDQVEPELRRFALDPRVS